jgi:hypothetical protein
MEKPSRIRPASVALLAALSVLLLAIATLQIYHHSQYGHYVPFGLHADVTASDRAKLFDAHLTNFGLVPKKVERCEFVSAAGAPEADVAYRLERLDTGTNTWETILDTEKNFCRPHLVVNRALWPGQTLSIGTEFMAARGDVTGKTMRFVLQANGRQFPTSPVEVIWVSR